jgi:hypothetical protein
LGKISDVETYISAQGTPQEDGQAASQQPRLPLHSSAAIMKSSTVILAVTALFVQSALSAPHEFLAPRQGQSHLAISNILTKQIQSRSRLLPPVPHRHLLLRPARPRPQTPRAKPKEKSRRPQLLPRLKQHPPRKRLPPRAKLPRLLRRRQQRQRARL